MEYHYLNTNTKIALMREKQQEKKSSHRLQPTPLGIVLRFPPLLVKENQRWCFTDWTMRISLKNKWKQRVGWSSFEIRSEGYLKLHGLHNFWKIYLCLTYRVKFWIVLTSLEYLLYKSAHHIRDSNVEIHNAHVPSVNTLNANMAFFTFTYNSQFTLFLFVTMEDMASGNLYRRMSFYPRGMGVGKGRVHVQGVGYRFNKGRVLFQEVGYSRGCRILYPTSTDI